METDQKQNTETQVTIPEGHPWLEVPSASLDEELRFSLDEIRFV